MSKGRKAIPVEREKLQEVIAGLEAATPFTSRNALWQAVAASDYAKSIGLSSQVAMLKAKAMDLVIATPLGKRGRSKGDGPVPNAGRKKGRRVALDVIKEMKQEVNPSLHKVVDRACSGSLKAAIKLKCIDCCAGDKHEVSLCTLTTCALWPHRPYKNKLTLTREGRTKVYLMDDSEDESEALGIIGPDVSRALVAV